MSSLPQTVLSWDAILIATYLSCSLIKTFLTSSSWRIITQMYENVFLYMKYVFSLFPFILLDLTTRLIYFMNEWCSSLTAVNNWFLSWNFIFQKKLRFLAYRRIYIFKSHWKLQIWKDLNLYDRKMTFPYKLFLSDQHLFYSEF